MQTIAPNIFYTGVAHPNRPLFDEFMALPDGTSYNSYVIKGDGKVALIDTCEPAKQEEFLNNITSLNLDIDYVISNHAEQDHSGCIPQILKMFPNALVVTNEKCKKILQDELSIRDDCFKIIQDRETLSLGDKTLEFIFAPWVHWPETMFTFCREEGILFSCDLFGSHIAFEELFVQDEAFVLSEAKRYFAGIMLPFRNFIKKHLETISTLTIRKIAPSHGPIYQNPSLIINAHKEWVHEQPKNEVVLAYVSMHGSTKAMADYLKSSLISKGITVKELNLTSELDKVLIELVDAATLIIGSPTFLGGAHPTAVHAAYLINLVRPKAKFFATFGSGEWGGQIAKTLLDHFTTYKPEQLGSVMATGHPKQQDFEALDALAQKINEHHKSLTL